MARTSGPSGHRSRLHHLSAVASALLVVTGGLTALSAVPAAADPVVTDPVVTNPVATGRPTGAGRDAAGCAGYLLDAPAPARRARTALGDGFAVAAARNDTTPAALRAEAADPSLWLDRCGRTFYADPAHGATGPEHTDPEHTDPEHTDHEHTDHVESSPAQASSAAAALPAPLSQTFALESRPGATRTIHLDFRGGPVSGTAWNESFGLPTISVAPYSVTAPADTAFTAAELTEIQRAWQVVAEDYAPFDVNVTTRDPGAAAIDRSSPADQVFGTRVVVTGGGPISDHCRCGGVAYVDVFDLEGPAHAYFQPAWVFTDGTGTAGKALAEAASHEAGHNFGLDHDGTRDRTYYLGSDPWAPVMGAGYRQPVTQWSRGEYLDASRGEDDVAVIASGAPLRPDDHRTGDAATVLTAGVPVGGVIGSRADLDGFAFTGSGATTVTATVPAHANLDLRMQVVAGDGTVVADVDPPVRRVSASVADGLGATWSGDLPAAGQYRVVLDGVGSGDPLVAGRYSDYGSLGAYELQVATTPVADPVSTPPGVEVRTVEPFRLLTSSLAAASVGREYRSRIVTAGADVAEGPVRWRLRGALPPGLDVRRARHGTALVLRGTPRRAGRWQVRVRAVDAAGRSATRRLAVRVRR